jgi:hypothetical protein
MSRLRPDLWPWRHFDSASAEVLSAVDIAAGVSEAGTTEAAIGISPTYSGSGAAVGTQTTASRVGGSVFWKPGLTIEFILRGTITTGVTPGTLILNCRLDSITGASIWISPTLTLLASQATVSTEIKGDIVCRSVGTAGTLFGMGKYLTDTTLIAAPAHIGMLPKTAPVVATIDTTANHQIIITALFNNAGSSFISQQQFWRTRD